MVGHTGIVHADMTLTRSNVKIKVTGLLNFRKLAKPCMLAAITICFLSGLSAFSFAPNFGRSLICAADIRHF